MEKVQWNSIDKKQNDLNIRKMTQASPFRLAKKQVPSSMPIGNVKLLHECFPNTLAWNSKK